MGVPAGWKNFSSAVLSADEVNNYLMSQSVMVFDSAAARTAGLGTPAEGMVTYLRDTNNLESYDGASWVAVGGATVPVGSMQMFAASTPPTGYLICNGDVVSRTVYAGLFAVIGTAFNTGGEAGTDFRLPDMRSRMPIGVGTGTGLSTRTLAQQGGLETRTIASSDLPTHQHTIDHDHANASSFIESTTHTHGGTTNNTNISHSHGIGFSGVGYAAGGSIMATPNSANPLTYPSVAADPFHAHSFGTGGQSVNHTHIVDIPAFTGSSGNGGFANNPIAIMNPFLGINFIIKF